MQNRFYLFYLLLFSPKLLKQSQSYPMRLPATMFPLCRPAPTCPTNRTGERKLHVPPLGWKSARPQTGMRACMFRVFPQFLSQVGHTAVAAGGSSVRSSEEYEPALP